MKKKVYASRFGFLVLNLFLQKQLEQTCVNLWSYYDVHHWVRNVWMFTTPTSIR